MIIAGLQKLTLIDYPNKVAAVVFTYGCNFSCPFCHNPELVDSSLKDKVEFISQEDFFKFLNSRKGLIEGVCITGGEPTLHHDLAEFISQIKSLGFLVKLDSNGTNPQVLADLLSKKLIDYIAMDIKAPLERYQEVVGRPTDTDKIKRSIELIKSSGIEYEFRSTVVEGLHSYDDLVAMAKLVMGAKRYFFQRFVAGPKLLDENFRTRKPPSDDVLGRAAEAARAYVVECGIR